LNHWIVPAPSPPSRFYYRSFHRTVVEAAVVEAAGVRIAELRFLGRAFDAVIMLATVD
jgi:hypothetical protein